MYISLKKKTGWILWSNKNVTDQQSRKNFCGETQGRVRDCVCMCADAEWLTGLCPPSLMQ